MPNWELSRAKQRERSHTITKSAAVSNCFQCRFWKSSGGYDGQNMFLSTLLNKKPLTTTQNIESEFTSWEYSFNSVSGHTIVCQNFLCILLDIKRGRFTIIQNKLKNNESLEDNRGKHKKQVEHLTDEIIIMINEHCLYRILNLTIVVNILR